MIITQLLTAYEPEDRVRILSTLSRNEICAITGETQKTREDILHKVATSDRICSQIEVTLTFEPF